MFKSGWSLDVWCWPVWLQLLTFIVKQRVNNRDSVLNIIFYRQALIACRNIVIRARLLATCQPQQTTEPVCLSSQWNNTSQMWFGSPRSEGKEKEPGSTAARQEPNNAIHLSGESDPIRWPPPNSHMTVTRWHQFTEVFRRKRRFALLLPCLELELRWQLSVQAFISGQRGLWIIWSNRGVISGKRYCRRPLFFFMLLHHKPNSFEFHCLVCPHNTARKAFFSLLKTHPIKGNEQEVFYCSITNNDTTSKQILSGTKLWFAVWMFSYICIHRAQGVLLARQVIYIT